MPLEQDEIDDIMKELEQLCVLSVPLGEERAALYARAEEYVKASVAEVYSPPRVTKAATALPRLGIHRESTCDFFSRTSKESHPDNSYAIFLKSRGNRRLP